MSIGKFPWVICLPRRGSTAIEMQVGRFYVRWCYLRGVDGNSHWSRWHPFQPSRWSFGWDSNNYES